MQEVFVESFDATKLFFNRELVEDARAAIVIVHGLCEHQGRYDYFAEKLHQAGISTYRFDHRGHGRSEGERTYYSDFNEILDDTNVFVDLAIKENPDKKLRGIITSGALVKDNGKLITSVDRNLDPHTKLPNELGSGVCSVREVVDWYGKDPYNTSTFTTGLCYSICDGLDWFADKMKDFAYPVLMMHGEKDGLVSVQDTMDFFATAASKDRQMKIYGGLFHEILNEYCRDEVIADVIAWMDHRI